MNKTLKIMLQVAIVAIVCVAFAAYAANTGEGFIKTAANKLAALFKDVRKIVYILGAFALVGFAWLAVMGQLAWKKVAILAIGLAVLAIADQVIKYATDSSDQSSNSGVLSDWNSDALAD